MTRASRPSLAQAFAAPSTPPPAAAPARAAALVGLLPPRPTPDPEPTTQPGQQEQTPPAPRGIDPEPDADTTGDDPGRIRNVAFYLPVDLLDRLRTTAQNRQLTYADLLVEAAAAHLEDVARQFADAQPAAVAGGMPTRLRRHRQGPGVQRQVRLDGHQLAWLDQQATRLQAPSRNALVVALFRAHLGEQ